MIQCSSCGKPIEKLPTWLAGTKVDFICNNCPNRSTKSIGLLANEADLKTSARADESIDEEEVSDDLAEV